MAVTKKSGSLKEQLGQAREVDAQREREREMRERRQKQEQEVRDHKARTKEAVNALRKLGPELAQIDERARTTVSVYVSTRDVEIVRRLAAANNATLQAMLRLIIREYLEREVGLASSKKTT